MKMSHPLRSRVRARRSRASRAISAGLLGAAALVPLAFAAPVGAAPAKPIGPVPAKASAATTAFLDQTAAAERKAYLRRDGLAVEASGWISTTIVEHASKRAGEQTTLVLNTRGGATYELEVPKGASISSSAAGDAAPKTLEDGEIVALDGKVQGNTITVSSARTTAAIVTPGLGPIQNASDRAPQTRTVLTILANFPSDRAAGTSVAQPVSQTQINTAMYSTTAGTRSVANFYKESSRGSLSITGSTTPWVNLTIPRVDDCSYTNQRNWVAQAEAAAKAQYGLDSDTFDRVMVVIPTTDATDCGWYGITYSSREMITWANSDPQPNPFRAGTAAHELGHSFGLDHSGLGGCRVSGAPSPLAAPAECSETGTDNWSDDMGWTDDFHTLQGFTRAALGFTPLSNVQTITASGQSWALTRNTVALGATKQLLRIRRPSAAPNATDQRAYLYLDLRGITTPFDNYPAGHATVNGVSVHLAGDFVQNPSLGNYAGHPVLVNPSPGFYLNGNAKYELPKVNGLYPDTDAAILAGQSIYDPAENFTITVDSVTTTTAQVRVTAGPPAGAPTTIAISGGTITVTGGTGKRNGIGIGRNASELTIADSQAAVTPPAGCRAVNPSAVACPYAGLRQLNVNLGDGNDWTTVTQEVNLPATINAGTGNDVVTSGVTTQVDSGSAPDGNDVYGIQRNGSSVSYAGRTAGLTFRGANPTTIDGEGDRIIGATKYIGTAGNDAFIVTDNGQTFEGGPGNDSYTSTDSYPTFITRDGTAESSISCGGTARLVRDASDATGGTCRGADTGAQAVITSGPAEGVVLLPTAVGSFTFASPFMAASGYECKLVQGTDTSPLSWSACGSTYTPSVPVDGTYTLAVQALTGGAALGDPQYRTFSVDRTVDTTLTPQPNSDSISYAFSSPEANGQFPVAYECSFDASAFRACTSPTRYSGLANGTSHVFKVRAVDTAGNIDATPASHTFVADTTPPETTITAGPAAGSSTTNTSASFSFTSSEPGSTFGCSLDSAALVPCTSPKLYEGLSVGNHSVAIVAYDAAGNMDLSAAGRSWTITAPPTRLLDIGAAQTVPASVNLTGDSTTPGTALDWVHWWGASPANLDRKAGTPLIPTWTKKDNLGTPIAWPGTWGPDPVYGWSNGSGSVPDGASIAGSATGSNGRGFSLAIPATNAAVRKLRIWVAVRGSTTTAALRVGFNGETATGPSLTGTSTTPLVRSYTITYRPTAATDTLNVSWYQGGGPTQNNGVILYAAAVY